MKRVMLLVIPVLISGCGAGITVRANVPPPPPPVVTVGVGVSAPPPPAPPGPPAPPAPAAGVTVDVEAEPIVEGDPEEVQATSEPPDPVYEEQTDSPNPGYVWVGGYWGWNGVDWGWNSGRWAAPPAGRVYIEPYYERVGGKVVYVRGSWGSHDAPRRSYGGDRIVFTAAVRPAGYVRGQHAVVEHRAGPAPGKRPGGAYAHATGTVRPLPKATAPQHVTASAHESATPRGGKEPAGHETVHENMHETVHETGHGKETTVRETTHETAHETGHGTETTTHETVHETVTGSRDAQKKAEPGEKKVDDKKAEPAHTTAAQLQPKKDKDKK